MEPPLVKPFHTVQTGRAISNLGLNIRALRTISPATLTAVEPNPVARDRLVNDDILPKEHVIDATAGKLPFADGAFDLSFTSGVLIHIAPDNLEQACAEIHRVSSKYIICCEYHSDKAEEINYRG